MNKWDIVKLIAMALVLVLAVVLITRIDSSQGHEEAEIVRRAVRNAALTCYAVEGAYPMDQKNEEGYPIEGSALQYLRDNYHLAYDEDRYYVTYDAFAHNVMPAIWVTQRGAALP